MFVWTLLMVVDWAATLPSSTTNLSLEAEVAIAYIVGFFQVFSYIAIMFLAKSNVWNNAPVHDPSQLAYGPPGGPYGGAVPPPPQQQQYAYNGQPGQQYYYQEQPVYNGPVSNATAPMNGNPHMVHVK